MLESCPLISVVVPTKNRAHCAIHMIESVLEIDSDALELVISDNSDDDTLETFVGQRSPDPRLRYERVRGLLSMTDNHNRAFDRVRGTYVFLMGDDDTVLPDLVALAQWAREGGWDAVTPTPTPCYFWPDVRHWFWGARQAGKLYARTYAGTVQAMDPQAAIVACLAHAGQGVQDLPKIYHGLVRRACLMEIRERTGTWFKGVSPDVYGALVLAAVARKYCQVDFPVSIAGVAGSSNSGRAALKQHKGDLKTDPHMRAYVDLVWPAEVPAFFSVETVWGQASLEAVAAMGLDPALFDLDYLFAKCLLGHPGQAKAILGQHARLRRERGRVRPPRLGRFLGLYLGLLAQKGMYYAKRLLRPTPAGALVSMDGGNTIQDSVGRYRAWSARASMPTWQAKC